MPRLPTYREKAEAYETAIEAILTGGVASYSVAGTSFTKHNIEGLERLAQYYRSRAEAETTGFVTVAAMHIEEA